MEEHEAVIRKAHENGSVAINICRSAMYIYINEGYILSRGFCTIVTAATRNKLLKGANTKDAQQC